MTKNIFITGGAGYIGSHAVKLFLEKGYQVTVFDNFEHGFHQVLEKLQALGSLDVIEGELKNLTQIQEALKTKQFDAVLHFAALCSVGESVQKPDIYFENNVGGTLNLLEAMRQSQIKKLIFSSTCAVYGNSQYLPLDEKHPLHPTSPYGETKLIAEKLIQSYSQLGDFDYIILRYFNVCGAVKDGTIGDSKKPSVHLMQNAVRGAMDIENFAYTCPQVDTPDGTPIRDYIDVEDLVLAHYLAYEALSGPVKNEIFNLSTGTGFSVREIIEKVEEIFQVKIEKKIGEQRSGEADKLYALPQKTQAQLGWHVQKSLQESVESLKKWYSHRPHGWDN